jgi:hypothetical protein
LHLKNCYLPKGRYFSLSGVFCTEMYSLNSYLCGINCLLCIIIPFLFSVLRIESRACSMLSMCSNTQPYPHPYNYPFVMGFSVNVC